LYPAQALRDELYTVSDLPDSLIIASGDFQQEMTKTGGFSPAYQGTNSEIFLTEEGPAFWDIFYNPGDDGDTLQFGQSCLVDGVYVKDQFADTYTATATSGSASGLSQTLTRQSISEWFGEDFPGQQETGINLFYMRCSIYNEFYPESEWDAWWMTVGAEDPIKKTDPQNSPIGTYGVGIVVS
jgi:hypothetical protein